MSIKRSFDFVLSLMSLILFAPIFLFLAILIKLHSQGPVFYRQIRVGLNNQTFVLYKFRTMIDGADKEGPRVTAAGDARVTGLGQVLRKYKLDELPQLLNVVKGEMSFVGPRPEVSEFLAYYPPKDREKVLSVRPGITDEASILFRHESELIASSKDPRKFYIEEVLPKKIALYKKYVDDHSFCIDLRIIWRTAFSIFCKGFEVRVPERD